MSEANIATIQSIYEAFGRGDVASILERVTDDVDWASESSSTIAPWHGVRHGKAEVTGFFEAFGTASDVIEFTPLSFTANDSGDVMAVVRLDMKVRATGRSGAMNIHHWWRLRDGKVWHYRGTEDTALVASLLG